MDACCPVRYRNALTLAIRKGWDYSTAAAHPRPESFARAWRRSRAELAHSGRSEPAGGCQRCWDLIATRRMLFSKSVIKKSAVSLTQEWLAAAPRQYTRAAFCSSTLSVQLHARRRWPCARRSLSRPPKCLASGVARPIGQLWPTRWGTRARAPCAFQRGTPPRPRGGAPRSCPGGLPASPVLALAPPGAPPQIPQPIGRFFPECVRQK